MTLMKRVLHDVSSNLRSARGQTLVEYALILLLIAIVVLYVLIGLGTTVNSTYTKINSTVSSAASR